MTDRQENKLSMYQAVLKVLSDNNAIWSGVLAFVAAFDEFKTNILSIQVQRQIEEASTTGVTMDKAAAKNAAIEKALPMVGSLVAYATVTNNNTLKEEIDFSKTDLDRSRDTILYDRLTLVANRANTHAAALIDYGVTGTDISDLATLNGNYFVVIQDPTTAKGAKVAAGKEIDRLLKENDTILDLRLDTLMLIYKTTQLEFYNKYKNARIIIDLGKGGGTTPDEPTP